MAQTSTKTKPQVAIVGRSGTALTVAAVIIGAVPLLYLLYAYAEGSITVSTVDQINSIFTIGIVLTAVAGVLSLVALVLHGTSLRQGVVASKGAQVLVSALILIVMVIFLFGTLLPRASALQNLNTTVAPFGHAIVTDCQAPLLQTQNDIKTANLDAQAQATNDSAFAGQMQADTTTLQGDLSALRIGLTALNTTTVPGSTYQAIYDGCVKDVKQEIALLNDPSAIPFPPAVVALVHIPSVSVLQLLQDAAGVAAGQIKIAAPDGSAQQLVQQALGQVVAQNSDPALTQEGVQLKQNADNTLRSDLSPLQPAPGLLP